MKEQPKNNSRMPYFLELYIREAAKTRPQYQRLVKHLDEQNEARQK